VIVQVPVTVPAPIAGLFCETPETSPPEYWTEQPDPEASIWKNLTAEQSPVVVADMEIVSPTSQLEEEPPAQLDVILAEVRVHGCGPAIAILQQTFIL
jgi:hypothetical protein